MTYCTYQYIANKNNGNHRKSNRNDIIRVKVFRGIEFFSYMHICNSIYYYTITYKNNLFN